MMHSNMIHLRETSKDNWVIFEEPEWWRTDIDQVKDLADSYVGLGFHETDMEAIDGTPLITLYNASLGWRVIQIRES